jgi:hypothetical protein
LVKLFQFSLKNKSAMLTQKYLYLSDKIPLWPFRSIFSNVILLHFLSVDDCSERNGFDFTNKSISNF